MKVFFYFLFHDHRPRYGRFVHLSVTPGGQIRLGDKFIWGVLVSQNLKLVSKGHKRIGNQKRYFLTFPSSV